MFHICIHQISTSNLVIPAQSLPSNVLVGGWNPVSVQFSVTNLNALLLQYNGLMTLILITSKLRLLLFLDAKLDTSPDWIPAFAGMTGGWF